MNRPYIIGIGGESAGGKSTLSNRLEKSLTGHKVKVFHMDAYYKKEALRPTITGLTNGKIYIDDNHPDALDLDRLHEDLRDTINSDAGKSPDIIIVEGLFALWDQTLLPLLDLKIYVDCDSDERLTRRIKRNLTFGQDLQEITERYVQAVQPRQKEYVLPTKWNADIIINGFSFPDVGCAVILTYLKEQAF
ncbi:MAG: hypothetical protein HDR26_07605 [Lachnospiraceae bacterium]|nr:hypothetical protein [Lachnospiraceae bacterium]